MRTNGLFVTGTDTGVGKTRVTFGLAAALWRRWSASCTDAADAGMQVRLWKPVQTGVEQGSADADSYILRAGSGTDQSEDEIASITLPDPLAPWMAAERAGTRIDYPALVAEGRRRMQEQRSFTLIEGAGGLAVPLNEHKLVADLAADLALPLVIVARPGLGTVNHTVLSVHFAQKYGLEVRGIIMNGCRDEDRIVIEENAMMIERFSGVPVIAKLPWFASEDLGRGDQYTLESAEHSLGNADPSPGNAERSLRYTERTLRNAEHTMDDVRKNSDTWYDAWRQIVDSGTDWQRLIQ